MYIVVKYQIHLRGRRGRDRMVVVYLQLPMQSVPITT
jgi:hypothetical protein